MKTDETEEGNCLIAEFTGLIRVEANAIYNKAQYYKPDPKDKRKRGIFMGYYDGLKYDTSWDWLMPVVEKIEQEGFCFSIQTSNIACMKPFDIHSISSYDVFKKDKKIEVVYDVVVEFIKWHNSQKQ
jgi:hypothetical protein